MMSIADGLEALRQPLPPSVHWHGIDGRRPTDRQVPGTVGPPCSPDMWLPRCSAGLEHKADPGPAPLGDRADPVIGAR
jgi:hypothetical protein